MSKMRISARRVAAELQKVISKMPLDVFWVAGLPEFQVQWQDVANAVRVAKLPMQPASVARVLCRYVSDELSADEIKDILARLRLKLVATQTRTWHVIRLSEKTIDEPVMDTIKAVPDRVMQRLRENKKGMRPKVQSFLMGGLLYLSVHLVSGYKEGPILYLATPPGDPVALVSSTTMAGLLRASVEGLGYKKYENPNLYGRDVKSLLRINSDSWKSNPEHLTEIPEYAPTPVVTASGIDYTNKAYDEKYVDNLLGPDPPLLTELNIKTSKPFFDPTLLNKQINFSLTIKGENVAKSLKSWVSKGALAPTSDFFRLFRELKSNNISYNGEDSD